MNYQQVDPAYWCKFQAVDRPSFIIISSVISAQCFLFCLFLRSLTIRVQHKILISSDEAVLFRLMALWFSIAFIKSFLNILVFWVFETNPDNKNQQSQIVLSGICLFLDKMSSFCLHSILIKIPCIWIKNTIMKLQQKQMTLPEKKRVDLVFKVLNFMRIYLKLRLLIIAINLSFIVYFLIDPNFGRFSKYLTLLTMGQAVVAIFIYTFGILSLNKFKDLLQFPKELEKKVIIQYSLLMLGCLSRLIFNFLYYFSFSVNTYKPSPNCADSRDKVSSVGYVYLSLGYTIMHLLPITTIILIYWPDIDNGYRRQSLISHIQNLNKKLKLSSNSCLLGSGKILISAEKFNQKQDTTEPQIDLNRSTVRVFYDK